MCRRRLGALRAPSTERAGLSHLFCRVGRRLCFLRRRNRPAPALGSQASRCHTSLRKVRRRFRRPLPLLFAVAAGLELLGGALYAPNNYDALMYRFPRMLHWWAVPAGTGSPRPDRDEPGRPGFEWLMMPLFVLTHSDRLFFLINIIAYLLAAGPGFPGCRRRRGCRRVAWAWMWLLPVALCYVTQAGSIGNDILAVTYFLAAIALVSGRDARSGKNCGSLFWRPDWQPGSRRRTCRCFCRWRARFGPPCAGCAFVRS